MYPRSLLIGTYTQLSNEGKQLQYVRLLLLLDEYGTLYHLYVPQYGHHLALHTFNFDQATIGILFLVLGGESVLLVVGYCNLGAALAEKKAWKYVHVRLCNNTNTCQAYEAVDSESQGARKRRCMCNVPFVCLADEQFSFDPGGEGLMLDACAIHFSSCQDKRVIVSSAVVDTAFGSSVAEIRVAPILRYVASFVGQYISNSACNIYLVSYGFLLKYIEAHSIRIFKEFTFDLGGKGFPSNDYVTCLPTDYPYSWQYGKITYGSAAGIVQVDYTKQGFDERFSFDLKGKGLVLVVVHNWMGSFVITSIPIYSLILILLNLVCAYGNIVIFDPGIMFGENCINEMEITLMLYGILKELVLEISDYVKPGHLLNVVVGNEYDVTLEVFHRSYNVEADMWSFGVITCILLCESRSFWARTESVLQSVLRVVPNLDDTHGMLHH